LSVCLSVCLSASISPGPHAGSLRIFLCMLPMAVAKSQGKGQFWGSSGPFKSILNLCWHRYSRRCRVRCKRYNSIANNVMQQNDHSVCQARANRNPENSDRRQWGDGSAQRRRSLISTIVLFSVELVGSVRLWSVVLVRVRNNMKIRVWKVYGQVLHLYCDAKNHGNATAAPDYEEYGQMNCCSA